MLNYILIYIGMGVAACFVHPRIRALLVDAARTKPKGAEAFFLPILIALLFVFCVMVWPIAIFRCKPRKPRTLLDAAEELSAKLIVRGFREWGSYNGCAPTSKTSDEKITLASHRGQNSSVLPSFSEGN
jgi:hypothetical protein